MSKGLSLYLLAITICISTASILLKPLIVVSEKQLNYQSVIMIDKAQLTYMIEKVTGDLGKASPEATNLLLGTAAQESHLGTYFYQMGSGPARGIFQIEPATEKDIWENYLEYKPTLKANIIALTGVKSPNVNHLTMNILYQICIARVHYLRVKEALPTDLDDMAIYWKRYWNTKHGAGTEEEFKHNYARFLG